jgi:hypothetical protein
MRIPPAGCRQRGSGQQTDRPGPARFSPNLRASAGQPPDSRPELLVGGMRVDGRREGGHVPREPLRHEEVRGASDVYRGPHAPEGVECFWELMSRGNLLRGAGPATIHSPGQVTPIRVATLNGDNGLQRRGLPLLCGHRPLPQVRWHGVARSHETRIWIGAPRRLWRLRGFWQVRTLSRNRK